MLWRCLIDHLIIDLLIYPKNKGIIIRPHCEIMKHILGIHKNIALITTRIFKTDNFFHAFITFKILESNIIRHVYVFHVHT